jgi:4-alpha-glucanotransferase
MDLIDEARRALGVRNLLVGVHDPAFPARVEDEIGRGSPYGAAGRRFLEWARGLGFDGVQFGPQGATSAGNPSPYDGTIFSKNPLSIDFRSLVDRGLVANETLERCARATPSGAERRVVYDHAWHATTAMLDEAYETFLRRADEQAELDAFIARHRAWLQRDALYEILCEEHHASHFSLWPADKDLGRFDALVERFPSEIRRYAFAQWIAHRQHDDARAELARLGFKLFGDLQIGVSESDAWALQSLFLKHHRMGAPPSRTHPLGQAWGYRVFDPDQYARGVREMLRARIDKMLDGLDGIRIDHPHGLVCPWVYRPVAATEHEKHGDPLAAVRAGARLFDSPAERDHTDLARWSIARADQIDASLPRWAERRVRDLDDAQVDRYGLLFDVVVDAIRARGGADALSSIACEVLSTQPYPLQRVIDRHGLGRFRVTQKVDLWNPADVYCSENARPEDWILIGNHDTRSIWSLVDAWADAGTLADHASYLAARLEPRDARARDRLAASLAADRHALAQAKCAELFASPARNVMISFCDLLGERETYNEPGTTSPDNWSLRIARDFEARHATMCREGTALDLRKAMAAGLRAKDLRPDLVAALSRDGT